MHLSTNSDKEVNDGEGMGETYVDELMHIFDVDLVAANPANEIHEAELATDEHNPNGYMER
jgi:hypothetical protein